MDFDPDHPQWHLYCCHLRNGIMMLAGSETVVSLIIFLCSFIYVSRANLKQENILYQTVGARVVAAIFFLATGITFIIQSLQRAADVNWEKSKDQKMHIEPSIDGRLMLFVFFMFLISMFIIYTLYLTVRCVRYIRIYRQFMRTRRYSSNIARQINPMDNQ
ncbi:hypothetical protein X798_02737 [Onchocerca flexuosa]|uniref:Uncharacterized protein n=1 Tax=Onchocerca flexuosa TaxID=387005 RepID=A0A238BY05_9BILA|nr:hypothetical protein X798_02737 [Onchocerca flexuosa]